VTHQLIPVAFIAGMIATPTMACTNWNAIATFDAIIAAKDKDDMAQCNATRVALNGGSTVFHPDFFEKERKKIQECNDGVILANQHYAEMIRQRDDALADNCQESAR
jgi:hypothetical protein